MVKPLSLEELKNYFTIPSSEAISKNGNLRDGMKMALFSAVEDSYILMSKRIYLGKLPQGKFNLPESVKIIISMSTYEELETSIIPGWWKDSGIQHIFVHMPDHTSDVATDDVVGALLRFHDFLAAYPEALVYIHCKQGHSRSIMMYCAHMMTKGDDGLIFEDVTNAFNYAKSKRSSANLEEKHQKLADVVSRYKVMAGKEEVMPEFTDINTYLASNYAKDVIRQLPAFKDLMIHAVRMRKLATSEFALGYVQQFFNTILTATDDEWYDDLLDKKGCLQRLREMTDISEEEMHNWNHHIDAFTDAVTAHLQEKKLTPVQPNLRLAFGRI